MGKDRIVLEKDLIYLDCRSKETFVIQAGFVCDGCSLPQFLWSVLGHPFSYPVRMAAILHDFLYRGNVVKRKVADQMFYDALVETGMDDNKAQVFYLGVRSGGASAYKKGSRG